MQRLIGQHAGSNQSFAENLHRGKREMSEPVKLSRERWEMLREAKTRLTGNALGDISAIVNTTLANRVGLLTVHEPLEINGIVFLPAEYVPYEPPCTCLTIPMVRA